MSRTYTFVRDESGLIYSFESVGKRTLKKVVTFKEIGTNFYNVALQTEDRGKLLPDTELSDNGDVRKVLRTTAAIIDYFSARNRTAKLFIRGSEDKRQRIYQELLVREIEARKMYKVLGLQEVEQPDGTVQAVWVPLKRGETYLAFLVFRV